jgi:hypothetical protein
MFAESNIMSATKIPETKLSSVLVHKLKLQTGAGMFEHYICIQNVEYKIPITKLDCAREFQRGGVIFIVTTRPYATDFLAYSQKRKYDRTQNHIFTRATNSDMKR